MFFACIVDPWLLLLIIPGYLITAGYIARSWCDLSFRSQMLIWGLSILYQGGWLVSFLIAAVRDGSSVGLPPIVVGWMIFATIGSVVGLVMDCDITIHETK